MKKLLLLSFSFALLLTIPTACGHTHTATGSWSSDLKNHWQLCECGETFNSGSHTLENDVCTVCGSEIVTYEDGGGYLSLCNEHGDCVYAAYYAADGSVEHEERYEYTYDADGSMLAETYYDGETLSAEYEYAQSSSGEIYFAKATNYNEDGSRSTGEYDEAGNMLYYANIAADGSVWDAAEYTYNDSGSWMGIKEYVNGTLAAEREYSLDADGNTLPLREITYNEDGSWYGIEYDLYGNEVIEIENDADGNVVMDRRFEHDYDAEGNKTLTKTYENGILIEEVEFLFGSDDEGSWSMSGKTTIYHEDGSKTVSDTDLEATWHTEITYDAAGNVVEELRYEYDQDEGGNATGSRGYKNGRLFTETQAITGPDGESAGMLWIDYHEDGSKTVSELDENLELVKETVYDAAGNVISES